MTVARWLLASVVLLVCAVAQAQTCPIVDLNGNCRLRADGWYECRPYSALSDGYQQFPLACGLRSDGSIGCPVKPVPYVPPAGTFTSVHTGDHGGCALNEAGALVCWGQIKSPKGTFTQFSVSDVTICGVLADGSAKCIGGNIGKDDPPAGAFAEVRVVSQTACGRHTDGTIECWGQLFPQNPPGTYVELQGSNELGGWCGRHSDGSVDCWDRFEWTPKSVVGTFTGLSSLAECGMLADGRARCWHNHWPYPMPAGTFTQIEEFGGQWCGLRGDASVTCWSDYGDVTEHPGNYVQVSGDCAIAADQTITCWGDHELNVPPGTFVKVGVTDSGACALNTDGHIVAWGLLGYSQISDNVFTDLAVGGVVGTAPCCGLAGDGSVQCFDGRIAPAGTFVKISKSYNVICGIKADGSVACGDGASSTVKTSLSGSFSDVFTAQGGGFCALRTADHTAVCSVPYSLPAGAFSDVVLSGNSMCGLHLDGSIECSYPVLPADGKIVSTGACSVCGDGDAQGAEVCDDGNLVANDGCSPDCTPDCPLHPRSDCAEAASGSFSALDDEASGKRSLKWKWGDGGAISTLGISDPRDNGRYDLCFYPDGANLGGQILMPSQDGWSLAVKDPSTSEYDYVDKRGARGLSSIKLVAGADGTAAISVKGKGTGLPAGLAGQSGPSVVQMIDPGRGKCWSTSFPAGTGDGVKYKAKL